MNLKSTIGTIGLVFICGLANAQQQTNDLFKKLQEKARLIKANEEEELPAPDIFFLATNEAVRKEIELVDDQVKRISQIEKDFSARINKGLKEFSRKLPQGDNRFAGFTPDLAADIQTFVDRLQTEKRQKMEDVLLPHQVQRLREMALQIHMDRSGEVAALSSPQVVEELGISEEQQKRLKERAEEITAEIEQEIKEIRAKGRKKLLQVLTKDQREKLETMIGNKFELPTDASRKRTTLRFKK